MNDVPSQIISHAVKTLRELSQLISYHPTLTQQARGSAEITIRQSFLICFSSSVLFHFVINIMLARGSKRKTSASHHGGLKLSVNIYIAEFNRAAPKLGWRAAAMCHTGLYFTILTDSSSVSLSFTECTEVYPQPPLLPTSLLQALSSCPPFWFLTC